jgi:peptidoglycan hydrolase CwlO-like protein
MPDNYEGKPPQKNWHLVKRKQKLQRDLEEAKEESQNISQRIQKLDMDMQQTQKQIDELGGELAY